MRKTIVGCVTCAAAVLALGACSSSAAPAAAPSTTHRTLPAAATAPSTTAPAAAGTTPPVASCTAQMAAWYAPVAQNSESSPIAGFHNTWTDVIPPDAATLAAQHAAAHGLLGATLTEAEPRGGPPACNSVAATAWDNAMTDLGDAATIEQSTATLGPPSPAALQDANDGFAQLSIVVTQGKLAMTSASASAPAPAAATTAPAAAGTATVAALWCGPGGNVMTSPSIAAWETTNGYGVVGQLKTGTAAIDNPATPAATVVALAASICGEVLTAHEEPPPVEQATWSEAMGFFLTATVDLHAVSDGGNYPTNLDSARVEANMGLSDLNEFLALTGT